MPKGKRLSADFKFKVALAAAKGTETLSALAGEYQIHPSQISEWKSQLLERGPDLFSTRTVQQQRDQAAREAELYAQIGRLQMEVEWLKKKVTPRAGG